MSQLRSIIIGAGSAGSQRADGNHAAAFVDNPKSVLLGIFDENQDLAKAGAQQHKCKHFKTFEAALKTQPDIISLAITPLYRANYIDAACKLSSVKAIYCEKPLAYTYKEAMDTINLCRQTNKRIYINYQRHANLTYLNLRDDIERGRRGNLQTATIYYTRGMWTNACHWVDLALMLFGRPIWVFAVQSPIPSPYLDDPNATILLGYNTFTIQLVPLLSWEDGFYTGDIELIFDREKLLVPNITHYETKDTMRWIKKDKRLQQTNSNIELHTYKNDFSSMVEQIITDINTEAPESYDPEDAAWSVLLLSMAEQSIKTGQRLDVSEGKLK